MKNHSFKQITIDSIEDIIHLSKKLNESSKSEMWWRGHADIKWLLTPSVNRDDGGLHRESNLTARFMSKARTRHNSCPSATDRAGWLFFMQHYGLPTRLLDWTESVLIATFFAVESQHEADAALIALNPFELNNYLFNETVLFHPSNLKNIINAPFVKNPKDEKKVAAILSDEVDLRMTLQHSVFTIHGGQKSMDEYIGKKFLYKIIIPSKVKRKLYNELNMLGIKRSNLFLDLQNLAKEMKQYKFKGQDQVQTEPIDNK